MSKRAAWWLSVLAKIWPLTWKSAYQVAKLRPVPLLGVLAEKMSVPLFTGANLNVSYIPINETIEGAPSSALSEAIVAQMIRRSSHRVILNRCTCRDAKQCTSHPIDFGCIQLGEGTRQIDPRIARHVSVEECLDYLRDAVADGLIPMIGRVRIDDLLWGVKNTGQMMCVCLCCRCCCTNLNSGKYWPPIAQASFHRLKGVHVEGDATRCTQCGTCIEQCFMDAIRFQGDAVVIDDMLCKGCGLCVSACQQEALRIVCDDVEAAADELMERLRPLITVEG